NPDMKRILLLPVLAMIFLFNSSFNMFEGQPATGKKTVTEPAKRCGPWFTAYNYGLTVTQIALTYPDASVHSITSPTFPCSFPQGSNGTYTIKVYISGIPSSGVYVAAGDQCKYSTSSPVTFTFVANVCVEYPITISNFACDI
ncbi:hypothetical protein, partial [Chitinophaga sp.]|uniref:hypothetical protein n=1 Tax=Chitinophaga sp. TaxID=1869181 RepID=UPI002F9553A1